MFAAFSAAALAQGVTPPGSPNPTPGTDGARQSIQGSTPSNTPANQPPQRGFIAPVIDIRIQGDGLLIPKPAAQPPLEAEKPAATPPAK